MTRKDFLTNLIREFGYQVKKYNAYSNHVDIFFVKPNGSRDSVSVWTDKASDKKHVYTKLKWSHSFCFSPSIPESAKQGAKAYRTINAFLLERGLEGIVMTQKYLDGRWGQKDVSYLKIYSDGYLWDQCAKVPNKEEVLSKALNGERYGRSYIS